MLNFFEKIISPFPIQEPEQPPRKLLAFCRYYTRGLEIPLLLLALLSALLAVLEVTLFGFMGQIVDWLAQKNPDTLLQQEGKKLLFMAFLILVVMPILVFFHATILHQTLLGNFPMRIRWLAHRYLLRQSIAFYHNDFAGRIATKVMQTSLSVRESVIKILDVIIYVSVYFGAILFLVATLDLLLVIPMVIWLFAYIAIQIYFVPQLKRVSALQADARSEMTGRIVDTYTNITTVKLFSHSQRESSYAKSSMQDFLVTVYKQMRLVTWFIVSVHAMNYLLIFSVASLSIFLWMQQWVGIGAIAVAVSLALRIDGMSQWVMWEIGALFENLGTVMDGMNTLAQPLEVTDKCDAKELHVAQGEIKFEQVSFHYGKSSGIIEDLDLVIQPGEKVGLVGRSGAGKSTLVNLLLRFHDLAKGRILIDGQDIATVTQDSLRARIGMVTQDLSLMHRSVRENIAYGHPNASEEELITATNKAKAHDFILELADFKERIGYDAQVGERGVKLSGGQRQRIAIARVLLKDAPILILDEATSALDSEVELAIQSSLSQLMQGKTVIAIAHRLFTIAKMDRLIVIDEGRIVEQGTHQELVAKNGLYAQLWQQQTGGFIAGD